MKIYRKRNILYLAGFLLLVVGVFSFAGSNNGVKESYESPFEVEACGVERWAVKVLTDADASSVNIFPVDTTLSYLVNLTTPKPDANAGRFPIEKQTYKIHCNLAEIKLESDGDYHLLLEDSAGNHMIGEIPDPTCSSTTGSLYIGDITRCREFIDKYYNVTGSFQTVNKKIVVTGVAFIDPPHGQSDAAPNNIELHSILDIEFEPVHNSGIAEIEASKREISVFPNPFTTQTEFRLNLNGQLHDNAILKVFDLKGKEIRSIEWPSNQMSVTMQRDGLSNGIYIYRLIAGGYEVAVGKIMAQ